MLQFSKRYCVQRERHSTSQLRDSWQEKY